MQDEQIREALSKHWQASAAGDADAEHEIYEDDAVCDYPQSGERILGRNNLQALRYLRWFKKVKFPLMMISESGPSLIPAASNSNCK